MEIAPKSHPSKNLVSLRLVDYSTARSCLLSTCVSSDNGYGENRLKRATQILVILLWAALHMAKAEGELVVGEESSFHRFALVLHRGWMFFMLSFVLASIDCSKGPRTSDRAVEREVVGKPSPLEQFASRLRRSDA
jgi:hypothetical protein